MFRVVAHRFGPPDRVLAYEPVEEPVLEPGCVLVRMLASAINPSDLIPVTGAYRHRTSLPFVPGYDGVGVVAETGKNTDPALVGCRVLPLRSAGNWQTCKAIPAESCVRVPDDLSDEQAATSYINPLTARLMVKEIAPKAGDLVGVTAAASTLGRMLVRMIAKTGARPVAVVRSQSSRAALRDEPVAEVVDEGAALPELTAGLDAVGGPAAVHLAAAIRPGGLLLHYGLLSGQPLTGALAVAGVNLKLFQLRDWMQTASRDALHAAMEQVFAEIRAGLAACPIAATYPLAAFREAIAFNSRRDRIGKVILRP